MLEVWNDSWDSFHTSVSIPYYKERCLGMQKLWHVLDVLKIMS